MKLYRPATILVGVLFILLGGLTRLATPEQVYDEQNMKAVRGTVGEVLQYGGGDSTVKVTRMKFAKAIVENDEDKPIETNGVFVAIEWDTVRGSEKPNNIKATLTADGGTVYAPIGLTNSGMDFPEAGFGKTGAVIFEVNPSDLKDLTLNVRPTMFFNTYNSYVLVDLGIPGDDIAQRMVDEAAAQYVLPRPVVRVAS